MHAPSGTTGEIWYTRKPVHGNWPFRSARCCWRTPVVPSAGWPPWRGTEPACLGPCPSGIKEIHREPIHRRAATGKNRRRHPVSWPWISRRPREPFAGPAVSFRVARSASISQRCAPPVLFAISFPYPPDSTRVDECRAGRDDSGDDTCRSTPDGTGHDIIAPGSDIVAVVLSTHPSIADRRQGEDLRQCHGHAASRSYRGGNVEVSSAASAADSVPLYSPQSCERGPRERNAWRLPRRLLGMISGTSGPGLSRAILTRCGQKRGGGASQARRPTSPNGFRCIGSQRLTRDRPLPILCILLQEGEISSSRLPCPNKIVIANSPQQTRPPSNQLGDSLPISDRMNWASSTLNAAVLYTHQIRFSISPRS